MNGRSALQVGFVFLAGTLLLRSAGIAAAVDITYVGLETNVEAKANTPSTGWRNTTPAKPLDIDGDNILGTDGYSIFQSSGQLASLPSYIGSVTRLAASQNSSTGWGVMDNPADPSGADTVAFGMWFNSDDIVQFTITGSDLDGKTLRLGVIRSGYGGTMTENVHVTQTVGGSATAESGAIQLSYDDGLDVLFFDIVNVSAGDTFKISVTDQVGGYKHASGLCFDSKAAAGTLLIIR